MDFTTFKEKLLNDDLKSVKPKPDMLERLRAKYQDIEIIGTYRLNENHTGIYFKHKLWHKLAIYRDDEWLETRVNSLKNQLPDETHKALLQNLGKSLSIIKIESVLPAEGEFYYYVIAKISGKKSVLHVSREGEVLLRSKFMEYSITIDEEEEDEEERAEMEEDEDIDEVVIVDVDEVDEGDDDDDDMD